MKPTCRHSWEFSHQTPNGEDRVFKHYVCRNCPQTSRRNVKKPRFTATSRRKPSVVPKLSKALQKGLKSKRKAIKPVSDKRKKQNAEYSMLRKAFLEEHPLCQVCLSEEANQIHHMNHREGKRLNDQNYWLAVGPDCHRQIHDQPAWAKEKGYLL